jgi:glucose/arabinose dehydrogenase
MARLSINRLFVVALAAAATVAACGSGDDDSGTGDTDGGLGDSSVGPGSDGSSGNPGDGSSLTDAKVGDGSGIKDANADAEDADSAVPDGPDLPPTGFPTSLPTNLYGYALQNAFPGTFLSGAMDIDWPVGSTQPYVLQRGGYVVRLHNDTTRDLVLDFSALVAFRDEAGALGMALHPKFNDPVAPQPYVYIWYNAEGNPTHQRLVRYTLNAVTKVFDPATAFILVEQTEGFTTHNGAHLKFGPDGYLYFGNGDDERTDVTAQTLTGGLFSGVFRIDVDMNAATGHAPPKQPLDCVTQGYLIPNDNPFVGVANAAEEYFALGFRNPYNFTFDKLNGNIWLGDVGDTWREEISQVVKGGNYQWPLYEGKKHDHPGDPTIGTAHAPVFDYTHASIGDLTAVMGGYSYRGALMPELAGKVIFSDWPTGRVWALDTVAGTRKSLIESNWDEPPVGWGQDAAGEVYLIAWSNIYKIVHAATPSTVPTKLSATHIFRNMQTLKTSSSLIPYSLRSPLWSDGAAKQRWAYVPTGMTATMTASGTVTLPDGAMMIKQFDLPATAQPVGRTKHLETRVLVIAHDAAANDVTWGVTYRWNAAGTDADLVLEATDEAISDVVPANARTWHYPSTGECWSCHRLENRVLGFRGEQMNFTVAGAVNNQLSDLATAGLFDTASITTAPAPLVSPSDPTASLADRASAYLAANCSSCHHPGASYLGGGDTWNALPNVPIGSRGLVNQPHHNYPMATALGLPNAPLISPGQPLNSILRGRLNGTDQDVRMPPLLRTQVDPVGSALIDAWITAGPQ